MKFHHIATKAGNQMIYNQENLRRMIENLFDGRYLVTYQRLDPQSDIKTYHRLYFAKIDALALDSGHVRAEMHEIVKEHVLAPLVEELPEVYEQPSFRTGVSVLGLTAEGWVVFIERFELWAFSEFGTILY